MTFSLDMAAVIVAVLGTLVAGGIIALVRLGNTVAQLQERVAQFQRQNTDQHASTARRLEQIDERLDRYNDRMENLNTIFSRKYYP